MKKNMKRFISFLLVLVLVFAVSSTVFAAEDTTIQAPTGSTRIYDVYQIFTGDYSENDSGKEVLSNVKWGKNGTGTEGTEVDEATLSALKAVNNMSDTEKLTVIKPYANFETEALGTVYDGNSLSVPTGYYLIKDNGSVGDGSVGDGAAYSLYIVEVVGPTTISPKVGTATSEKKVRDVNDSMRITSDWQDSADYDIGDKVPYKLTATLPENVSAYSTYNLKFVDIISKGLTYDAGSAKVYVNNGFVGKVEPNTENYGGDEILYKGGNVLTWSFDDIKSAPYNVGDNDDITIEYTATLNENAVIGDAGNPNKMHIEYSNNPNGAGTGTTMDDINIVFTYKTVVNKVTENPNYDPQVEGSEKYIKLVGADFTLEKYDQGSDAWNVIAAVKSNNGTTFSFNGLDDGKYRLKETKTPSGYNTIKDIEFTVTAEHEVKSDNPALTSLRGNASSEELAFTANISDGSLTTDVENKAGATLPETGGMGTTLFYIVGGILVVGSAVLLITKKRMNSEK